MDDALRMNDDFDRIARRAEEPMRFDDFEALVHHRRRIDRDFATHRPIRMSAGFVRRDAREIRRRTCAKRSARSRQQDATNACGPRRTRVARRQTLENRVVLAVDRQQRRAALFDCRHEQCAADHQRFLVGEQDAFARTRGGERRCKARGADDRSEHRIDVGQRCGLGQRGCAAGDACSRTSDSDVAFQSAAGIFIEQHGERRLVPPAQFTELLPIAMRRQCGDREAIRMLRDDIERRCADRARCAQQ